MSDEFSCPSCWADIIISPTSENCPRCGDPINVETVHTHALAHSSQSQVLTTGYVWPTAFGIDTDNLGNIPDRSDKVFKLPEVPHHHSLRYLGAGGMSQVCYGEQDHTNRAVAIKFLHPNFAGDDSQQKRFVSEMKAMGRVVHPNVMPIIAVGEYDSRLYYTMRYMSEGSLFQQIRRDQPASDFKTVARWMMQAGHGIAAGHALNILHRDIKPSNILLNDDGVAMIADYGLAKFLDETEGLTQSQAILGTSNYMSPEQAEGRISQLNFRSDVYSLGATLYHMLTGQTPFKAASTVETLRRVVHEELPRPRSIHPTIPEPLERICLKAIEKNPADRYESAEAFANDLARYLENQRPVGQPVTRIQKAGRLLKRNRVRIAMIATSLIVSLTVALRPAPKEPSVAESPTSRAELEAALGRGEEVTLVGPTGRPNYYRWQHGETTLFPTDGSDAPANLKTLVSSRLALVEDPMCDHYRIRAEFQQASTVRTKGLIGLWFGVDLPIEDQMLHYVVQMEWSEFYIGNPDSPIGNGQTYRDIHRLHGRLQADTYPENTLGIHTYGIDSFLFEPYHYKAEKSWRTIEIEVSPAGFQVKFQLDPPPAKLVDAFPVSSDRLNDDMNEYVKKYCNTVQIPEPEYQPIWTPRGPLGIRATSAIVSFRNVVLTPLPPVENE